MVDPSVGTWPTRCSCTGTHYTGRHDTPSDASLYTPPAELRKSADGWSKRSFQWSYCQRTQMVADDAFGGEDTVLHDIDYLKAREGFVCSVIMIVMASVHPSIWLVILAA